MCFARFVCLLIYQFILVFHDIRKITQGLKNKIKLIDEILQNIKDKVNSTANYVGIVFNGVEKVVDYIQKKNTKKSTNASNDPFNQSPPKRKSRTKKNTTPDINQQEL